jgi:hypothetical protein
VTESAYKLAFGRTGGLQSRQDLVTQCLWQSTEARIASKRRANSMRAAPPGAQPGSMR